MLSLPPSLFMQFVQINNHEDSLSFSNRQKIDRQNKDRWNIYAENVRFLRAPQHSVNELVPGKIIFHEGVFSMSSINCPDTVSCSMKLDGAALAHLLSSQIWKAVQRGLFIREGMKLMITTTTK